MRPYVLLFQNERRQWVVLASFDEPVDAENFRDLLSSQEPARPTMLLLVRRVLIDPRPDDQRGEP